MKIACRCPIRWSSAKSAGPYAIPIFTIHACLAACIPWLFSWTGLIIMILGVHVFGQAITICYHRLLAHHSARVPKWFEHFFVIMALCCMEDTPGKWVATHRFHHNHSDEQPDPHSPLVNFLWSHIGWLMVHNGGTHNIETYRKICTGHLPRSVLHAPRTRLPVGVDLASPRVLFSFIAGAAIGFFTGGPVEAVRFGLSLLVWGVLVRTVVVWHITWSVNSLTHLFGYRNYKTDDHSRNNWFVALITVGEGWHNNHHHDPASGSTRHRWWEFDISYYELKLLEKLGLAKNVTKPCHERHREREAAQQRSAINPYLINNPTHPCSAGVHPARAVSSHRPPALRAHRATSHGIRAMRAAQ